MTAFPMERLLARMFFARFFESDVTHLTFLATSLGLAAPLVFYFFLLCGMRVLFGLPTLIRSNWVFRMHAPEDRAAQVLSGAKLSMMLADLLLVGLKEIPFACTYYPGRSRAQNLWPIYAGALITYAFGLASIEREAMRRPAVFVVFAACIAAAIAGVAWFRRLTLESLPGLVFEEEDPDQIVEVFRLSEGLAAETVRRVPGLSPPAAPR